MAKKPEDRLDEIAARVRRIETRQMRMALAQGVDPTQGKVRFAVVDGGAVEVSGLDVSLADLLAYCGTSGISGRLYLQHNGEHLAIIEIPTKE